MSYTINTWWDRIKPYLRLQSFNINSEQGRARERQRRALLSTLAALLGKVVSVGTSLITIPLTLNYLGAERFGLWMTISSIVAMLAFADLGIGNGLLNVVSAANGRDDLEEIQRHISSAALILSAIAGVMFLTFLIAYQFAPWAEIFNVHSKQATIEAGPAVFVLMTCLALNVPASIVQRVQLGMQLGFLANLWQAAGSLFALVGVFSAVLLKAPLPMLVFALAGMPVAAALMNNAWFFFRMRPDLAPKLKLATRLSAKTIAKTGLLFLILQIVAAATYSSDNLIIARALGASAVTTYAIPEKLFSIISVMLSIMLTPLWPAYGEAIARGDGAWVKSIFNKSLLISMCVAGCGSVFLVALGQKLVNLWIGHSVVIPLALIIAMGTWKVVEAAGNAFAVLFNGANIVGFQVKVALTTAIMAIVLKLYLVTRIGVSGPVVATIVCYSLFALLPYTYIGRRVIASKTASQSA